MTKESSSVHEVEQLTTPATTKENFQTGLSGAALDEDEVYTRAEQRKIIHRIDRRLVTALGMLFAISLLDRSNLGSAAIAG